MLELAYKNVKTVIITVFKVSKKLRRDIENIFKRLKPYRDETIMCRMKNTLNEI